MVNFIVCCIYVLYPPLYLIINSYESPINLLSRDHKTPIKRLQDSYKSPINSYKSLIKRLQQSITKCWNI